jgi:hypothetical protein
VKTPIEKVQHLISSISEPGEMPVRDAVEMYEDLISWLEDNLVGLYETLKSQEIEE